MKRIKIPKRNGKYRSIYIPNRWHQIKLEKYKHQLDWIYMNAGIPSCVHGFVHGKSAVTNAKEHIGYNWTLSCDLFSFFDTIRKKHVSNLVPREILREVFVDGAPRQGLCTSPVISNIAMLSFDRAMMAVCRLIHVKYTRYADDITLSGNSLRNVQYAFRSAKKYLKSMKLYIENSKTKLQSRKGGRRIITGVGVDDHQIYPTRNFRRRLRAAKHQGNSAAVAGMEEWAALKLPDASIPVRATTHNDQKVFTTTMGGCTSHTKTIKGAVGGIRRRIKNKVAAALTK